MKFLQTTSK